jgi:hypothetical protein
MNLGNKAIDADTFSMVKHDIKNQLSNITLLIEQLRHETPESPDYEANLDMLATSATKIDSILKSTD